MEAKKRIKRVAVYLRKSRNNEGEETEEALAKHRKCLLDIAEKNNWEFKSFQEFGSSMDENRPEYQKMICEIKENLFDAVLSVNLARVSWAFSIMFFFIVVYHEFNLDIKTSYGILLFL